MDVLLPLMVSGGALAALGPTLAPYGGGAADLRRLAAEVERRADVERTDGRPDADPAEPAKD